MISLGNLISNLIFSILEVDDAFVTFTILLFESGVCLPFNKINALNLIRNHKSKREIKIEREQILTLFPEKRKKISKTYTYIRVLTTFITLKKTEPQKLKKKLKNALQPDHK